MILTFGRDSVVTSPARFCFSSTAIPLLIPIKGVQRYYLFLIYANLFLKKYLFFLFLFFNRLILTSLRLFNSLRLFSPLCLFTSLCFLPHFCLDSLDFLSHFVLNELFLALARRSFYSIFRAHPCSSVGGYVSLPLSNVGEAEWLFMLSS